MEAASDQPVRARVEVGEELKRLRLRAGFTHSDVRTRLGLQPGETTRWESGRGELTEGDVDRLMRLYRASPVERTLVLRMFDGSSVTNGVFISYRRDDTAAFAGRLYDRAVVRFGSNQVFRDVDSIMLGADFMQALDATLAGCKVLLTVIGPRWSDAADEAGRRRLDDSDDLVRQEVERGLARDVFVIPLLVDGASLPRGADLPSSLAPLARRHGRVMSSDARFEADCTDLLDAIEEILAR